MLSHALILSFTLVTAATEAAPPADPLDKVKCVREPIIGSLAKSRKVCHTLREWQAIRERAGDEASRFIQPGWISGEPPEDKVKLEPAVAQ